MAVEAETTLAHLRRRENARRAEGTARAERLRAQLPKAVSLLRARGAGRVWLFGSLAGSEPSPMADIDLAAEGLPRAHYFEALAEVMEVFQADVDLVRIEDAHDSLAARIEAEGILL